jgi:hypothetical protein
LENETPLRSCRPPGFFHGEHEVDLKDTKENRNWKNLRK